MAELVLNDPDVHLYGPVLGLPELRAEIAARWSAAYGGRIGAARSPITSGCNEAYTALTSTLCTEGDEIILPLPWYFNHKMWHDMAGIRTVPLPTGPGLIPEPDAAARLITDRTRAIVARQPEQPRRRRISRRDPARLSRARPGRDGIALIVDETYRDFDSRATRTAKPPHELFADPDWADTLIHLYSFSKAYRLTGHRVGAIVAPAQRLLAEAEKFLDTVTICPAQLGQHGALWGMRNLGHWVAGERAEILARRAALDGRLPPARGEGLAAPRLRRLFRLCRASLSPALARGARSGWLPRPGSCCCPARCSCPRAIRDGAAPVPHRLRQRRPQRRSPTVIDRLAARAPLTCAASGRRLFSGPICGPV